MKYLKYLFAMFLAVGFVACMSDSYDADEDGSKTLYAEMIDVYVSGTRVTKLETDAGESLNFSSALSISATHEVNDTVFRMMLYYYKSGSGPIEIVGNTTGTVMLPVKSSEAATDKTDEISEVTVSRLPGGKYINFSLALSGTATDTYNHILSFVEDSVVAASGGTNAYYITLRHDNVGYIGNYTSPRYVSIPTASYNAGDELNISINTASGLVTRAFKIE